VVAVIQSSGSLAQRVFEPRAMTSPTATGRSPNSLNKIADPRPDEDHAHAVERHGITWRMKRSHARHDWRESVRSTAGIVCSSCSGGRRHRKRSGEIERWHVTRPLALSHRDIRNFVGSHRGGLSFLLDTLASSPDLPISFCRSVVSSASTARVSARSASAPS
jgi:hypothetical protein